MRIHKIKIFMLIGLMFCAGSVFAKTITVNCNGDATARQDIQTAINKANPGDTVSLQGTCILDPTPITINTSNLTIAGAGVSNNWSTVLTYPPNSLSTVNSLFQIVGLQKDLTNITIQGIKFEETVNTILLMPQLNGTAYNSCPPLGSHTINGFNIINNWFDKSYTAVWEGGAISNLVIKNNLFTNTQNNEFDLLLEGSIIGCNGNPGYVDAGPINNALVSGNVVKNSAALISFYVSGASNLLMDNNTEENSTNSYAPVQLWGVSNSAILDNSLDGGPASLLGIEDFTGSGVFTIAAGKNLIGGNVIKNSFTGIAVDGGMSDQALIANNFINIQPSGVDVILCDANANTNSVAATVCDVIGTASYNNLVVKLFPNVSVMNLGNNNIVQ